MYQDNIFVYIIGINGITYVQEYNVRSAYVCMGKGCVRTHQWMNEQAYMNIEDELPLYKYLNTLQSI